jgi:hypothetical protein
MNTVLSSAVRLHPRRFALRVGFTALPVLLFAACSEQGILEPGTRSATSPAAIGAPIHAVLVTPDYSTFDTRADFNGNGVIAHLNGFDEFSGAMSYEQANPWPTNGVTYTSGYNIVLGPGIGLGIQSNSLATNYGSPLTGEFAATDMLTLFGADLTTFLSKVPIGAVLYTNLGSYSFPSLDVPLTGTGSRFFGVALARSGEYFTGFRFTVGAGGALLLDNVAVGHVAMSNAEPVASAGGPYAGAEGAAVALVLGGSDADGDALSFTWDLGDGTTGSGPTPPSSHVYADNGEYDLSLTVSDGRGGTHTAHAAVSVANVAPVVGAFGVPTTPLALTLAGVSVPVATTYVDPGTLDVHTATLDCGTGTIAAVDMPNGTAGGTCTYTAPGVYTVQVTVYDDDDGVDTRMATGQVVVYDPGAGWLTGGGWIASPAGAYAPAPLVGGKLAFRFVARYGRSAETPDGSAELNLDLGKLDFRSTALEWLVVSGGVAHLRGYGTVNGAGDFGFALSAIDGSSGDAVRVRIWNRADGVVVYDNQAGESMDSDTASPLAGGSITVHSR